ncbi:hypothetical protein QWJ34_01180 [Saccharibacillus sp. CPCC 101409]|uniref:hypothetical protein n=1 Tax=Saccharibacillus sp. CPCC 101409 TaxID=3058041 RepID=UPI002671829F|nr:hypothetical protein [Saccharibacillus sp. CPCC 101409]MDO3408373.1 hypothetical protein [Saccharibacillus sp. CPCC 101409]
MPNNFFVVVSAMFLIQSLLRLFIVQGKAEFPDKRLKRRYVWTHTLLAALLLIPALLLLYYLPERTALPPAIGLVSAIYLLHFFIDLKFVRPTREHVVSGILAILYAAVAVGLYFASLHAQPDPELEAAVSRLMTGVG